MSRLDLRVEVRVPSEAEVGALALRLELDVRVKNALLRRGAGTVVYVRIAGSASPSTSHTLAAIFREYRALYGVGLSPKFRLLRGRRLQQDGRGQRFDAMNRLKR